MWILLTPCWERIPELRVIICNEPNPKSPAKAAVTSEGAQTQIQTSVTYPSSTGCACNINTAPVPGDKSKPQTCWCPSCAWFTKTGLQAFPITTGHATGMAGSKGHDCFLLQRASMFLLLFDTVNKSEARFDIYTKAVSLQSGNENKELDYRNLSTPPSHWSSPHPLLCQYLQFCSYFLLLNLAMGNAKITPVYSCLSQQVQLWGREQNKNKPSNREVKQWWEQASCKAFKPAVFYWHIPLCEQDILLLQHLQSWVKARRDMTEV